MKYFFPLDRLAEWNRLYERRGFLQYQYVVPEAATVRALADQLLAARCPIPLAVLKRLARPLLTRPCRSRSPAGRSPSTSPPTPTGCQSCSTAAMAWWPPPAGRCTWPRTRMRPELFRAMYPSFVSWRAARDRLDPAGKLCSDFARRLELLEVPG
jgi:decaprenylphospho-beta-D-ribofuranose 2-oxidase